MMIDISDIATRVPQKCIIKAENSYSGVFDDPEHGYKHGFRYSAMLDMSDIVTRI